MDLRRGGKAAIERMLEAYGFSTKQALCEQLGISSSTLANRFLRDTFPADFVIQCSLETGASLRWLTFGEGVKFEGRESNTISLPRKTIIRGSIVEGDRLELDKQLIPNDLVKPVAIFEDNIMYLSEESFTEIIDGKWLVEVEGKVSIKEVTRIPVGKIKLSGSGASFECSVSDIAFHAKCRCVFSSNL